MYKHLLDYLKSELKKSEVIFKLFEKINNEKKAEILNIKELYVVFDYNKKRMNLLEKSLECIREAFYQYFDRSYEEKRKKMMTDL
jgi:hypothetical protein